MSDLRRMSVLAALALVVIMIVLPLGLVTPPAPSAPVRTGCVTCHTDAAMLKPLVRPFPELPAEGEG
jgi:hypothetical protein